MGVCAPAHKAERRPVVALGRLASPTSDQVVYEDDHSYDQQDMNQAATDVTEETQQPQDHQNHHYCPQHYFHSPFG